MPQKVIFVDTVGDISFYKRRGTKSVKIRISGSDVRVSMPLWMPYKAALLYVESKAMWINHHKKDKLFFTHGQLIGKRHTLVIEQTQAQRTTTRITDSKILVRLPRDKKASDDEVQSKIEAAAKRALQIESEEIIIPRVRRMAIEHNFSVDSISIKKLRSRWGSCSSKRELVFSLYLIQLPWELIDYVIYHELVHTIHMNHSQQFWQEVAQFVPSYKALRKQLKNYSPHVRMA